MVKCFITKNCNHCKQHSTTKSLTFVSYLNIPKTPFDLYKGLN